MEKLLSGNAPCCNLPFVGSGLFTLSTITCLISGILKEREASSPHRSQWRSRLSVRLDHKNTSKLQYCQGMGEPRLQGMWGNVNKEHVSYPLGILATSDNFWESTTQVDMVLWYIYFFFLNRGVLVFCLLLRDAISPVSWEKKSSSSVELAQTPFLKKQGHHKIEILSFLNAYNETACIYTWRLRHQTSKGTLGFESDTCVPELLEFLSRSILGDFIPV